MSEEQPTVYIVDDDPSFLRSIQRMLRSNGYATECFASADEFLARPSQDAVGCLVTDLRMPAMDGLSLQTALARSSNPLPVVFLTGHGDIPASVSAMRNGAEDFLVKTAPKEAIIDAVERALARNRLERQATANRHALRVRFERLTARERQVLSHVVRGRINKVIAADLGIDERSVKRHRTNLMRKLEVGTLAELVRLTIDLGFVSQD